MLVSPKVKSFEGDLMVVVVVCGLCSAKVEYDGACYRLSWVDIVPFSFVMAQTNLAVVPVGSPAIMSFLNLI